MKALLTALLLSLVANAGLLIAVAIHPETAPGPLRGFLPHAAAPAVATTTPAAPRPAAKPATLWSAFKPDDLPGLITQLKSAGFPPNVIRAIASAQIQAGFAARMKALNDSLQQTPYWEPSASLWNNPKLTEERAQIYRDRSKLMRELMGNISPEAEGAMIEQGGRNGNLPKAKMDLIQQINDDYAELASQIRAATRGITLPEDRAKLALLDTEKHKDLAAILSPDELADYEMRTSVITQRLRQALTLMNASEAEFRAIYAIQQPYADILYPGANGGSMQFEQRRAIQDKVTADTKTVLGEARAAEFARSSDNEFQQLARAVQAENLPMTAAVQAYDIRSQNSTEATRISTDKSLSTDQKLAAMSALAQATRDRLISALGPTAGPAYADSSRWLKATASGTVVTFSGSTTMYRPIR